MVHLKIPKGSKVNVCLKMIKCSVLFYINSNLTIFTAYMNGTLTESL